MNQTSKNNRPSATSLRGWLNICFGLIVVVLSLVAATGKTPIGSFFVYCLSFAFGMFYPFVLAIFILLGLHRIFVRKSMNLKGNFTLTLGFVLIVLAALGFGSYGIYTTKNGGVDFTSLNTVYMDRMNSFARNFWKIDSFESLSGLGGGYFGLFLITLLGSIWGGVGDAIFFSMLMFFGFFLFMFNPVKGIVGFFVEKRKNQVRYSSPYRPKKDKSNPHLQRDISMMNAEKNDSEDSSSPENDKYPMPSKNATAPIDNTWSDIEQGSFDSEKQIGDPLPDVIETYESNITALDIADTPSASVETPKKTIIEPVSPFVQKTSDFNIADDDFMTIQPQRVPVEAQKKPEPVPPVSQAQASPAPESKTPYPPFQPEPDFQPVKAKPVADTSTAFRSAYSVFTEKTSAPANTMETQPKPEIHENVVPPVQQNVVRSVQQPVGNPLEKVNATAPVRNTQPTEFKVASLKPEPAPVIQEEPNEEEKEPVLTEEEIEKKKEQDYFAYKQQKKAEALLAKKKEKEDRISALMRYVSDVPRNYGYDLPSDALLEEFDDSAKMQKNTDSAQEKAEVINRVFDEFGVKAKATSFTIGASVTRFNVETEHGEKADKIANLNSEFQRALNGDMSVRVETVVEGRSTSGIEVGNIAPMAVSFKDMFVDIEQDHKNLLLIPIGKDISGNIVTFPLNKMPHMLVAGTTGSGKSVLIHSIIMTLIMRTYPSQCKLMLIDPKQVEFIRYQDCSHLFCPVISKPESAILALKKLCDEMDRRFTVLSKCRCANIEDYEEIRRGNEARYEDMPYIVTVIDEFADLIQTGGVEVTKYVTRIAQKARACGIHLIIATQRPSKDNVPMIIKANVPCRIGLSCSSQIDSRVILDEVGAETLLGKGDLLFKCPGKKSLIRAQSPFISNKDINTVLEYVKKNAGDPNYDKEFLDLDVQPQEEEVDVEGDLYTDIRDYVIHTGITSKTAIMRSFQVSSQKADQFLARLQSESVIALGGSGKYILGPAAHLEDY